MRWLLLAMLAGCYSPPSLKPTCVACGEGGSCPPDLMCIDGMCRSPSDPCTMPDDAGRDVMPDGVPTPTDLDGDGIPNATDKCPTVYEPLNRDHDNDIVGDPCDKCPHIAANTSGQPHPDGDGDGVGDQCDPRPNAAGEMRLAFYGFYDGNETTWDNQFFSFGNGKAVVQTAPQNAAFHLFTPLGTGVNDIEVRASINIQALSTMAGVVSYAGIAVRRTSSGQHDCVLQFEDTGNVRIVVYRDGNSSTTSFSGTAIQSHEFRQVAIGNGGTATTGGACRLDGAGPNKQSLTNPSVATGFGIIGNAANIEVDYIFAMRAVATP